MFCIIKQEEFGLCLRKWKGLWLWRVGKYAEEVQRGEDREIQLEGLGPEAETVPRRRFFEADSPKTACLPACLTYLFI